MRTRQFVAAALGAAALFIPTQVVSAQAAPEVKYTVATKVEFGGPLGRVMRFMGKGGKTVTETRWYSGTRMRTDMDKASTVMDAKAGSVMTLEHEPKTYWLWTVNDPILVVETMGDSMPEPGKARKRPKTKYTVTLSNDRTGKKETIAGMPAEQVTVMLRVDGETYNEEADSVEKGSLVVLSDLWLTPEFAGSAAEKAFAEAWSARMTRAFDSAQMALAAKQMEMAYNQEPRLRIAVNKLDSALKELKGYSLRTVSHYVVVPDGATFNREAVLRDAEKSLASDIAENVVNNAANNAMGRLGGLAGVRLGRQQAAKPQQAVIMRSRHEITEFTPGAIPADKFEAPANYKRRTPSGG